MQGERGFFFFPFFFTPSGVIVLNTPSLQLVAPPGLFSEVVLGVQEHYRAGSAAANGFLCLSSKNKGFFQLFSCCWLDFMAAISPSVGKPPLCSHFRRVGNSSSP